MNKLERMKEILKANHDFGKRVGYKMCVVDELHDMLEMHNFNKRDYQGEFIGDKEEENNNDSSRAL